jgi:Ring finger domain
VVAHSDICEQLQGQCGSSKQQSKLPCITLASPSHDTAETILEEGESGHECPVCMEKFQVNDIVSWSPSPECEHVFHHVCIKTWLIHHDCCPYCRLNVLTVDRGTTQDATRRSSFGGWKSTVKPKDYHPREELLQMAQQRHRRLCTTYFCSEEGLVTLDRPLSTAQKKAYRRSGEEDRRNIASNVSSEEMMALRVHPKTDATMHHEDVMVTVQAVNGISHFADEVVDIELSRISDEAGLGNDSNNANHCVH